MRNGETESVSLPGGFADIVRHPFEYWTTYDLLSTLTMICSAIQRRVAIQCIATPSAPHPSCPAQQAFVFSITLAEKSADDLNHGAFSDYRSLFDTIAYYLQFSQFQRFKKMTIELFTDDKGKHFIIFRKVR